MADEVVQIKGVISVDTGASSKSMGEFEAEIKKAKAALKDAKIGSDEYKAAAAQLAKVQGDLSSATSTNTGSFSKLKGEMATMPAASSAATSGLNSFRGALDLLRANPIILVITVLVGLIVLVAKKLSETEAVGDSLGRAFGVLSAIMDKLVNLVIKPLIDAVVAVIDAFSSAATWIAGLFSDSLGEAAKRGGELADELDSLTEAAEENRLALAESNAALQEARDIAADGTVAIKDRIKAIQDASRIEKQILGEDIKNSVDTARVKMEIIANEVGARQGLLETIRNGSVEQLKAARLELLTMKDIDKEKVKEITDLLIKAEESSRQRSKIDLKETKQTQGLLKQDAAEKEGIAKEAAAKQKKINDDAAKARLDAAKKEVDEQKKLADEHQKIQDRIAQRAVEMRADMDERIKQEDKDKVDRAKALLELEGKAEADRTDALLNYEKKRAELAELYNPTAENKIAKINADLAIELKGIAEGDLQRHILMKKAADDRLAVEKEAAAATVEIEKLTNKQKLDITSSTLGNLADIVGKESAAGKALAVAQTTIDTIQAAQSAYKAMAGIPVVGPALGAIAAVAAGVAGIKNVKKILAVKIPGSSAGGSSPSIDVPTAPVLPTQTNTTLDQSSINGIGNAAAGGVNRAFVLDADVTNASERNARLNRAARLG